MARGIPVSRWRTSPQANENGEIYEKDCFDQFINSYFVENKLNIPVDIQHRSDLLSLAGRVIYAEVNSVGLYFVAYIPKTYIYYDVVKNNLKEKILQGFSKLFFYRIFFFKTVTTN